MMMLSNREQFIWLLNRNSPSNRSLLNLASALILYALGSKNLVSIRSRKTAAITFLKKIHDLETQIRDLNKKLAHKDEVIDTLKKSIGIISNH